MNTDMIGVYIAATQNTVKVVTDMLVFLNKVNSQGVLEPAYVKANRDILEKGRIMLHSCVVGMLTSCRSYISVMDASTASLVMWLLLGDGVDEGEMFTLYGILLTVMSNVYHVITQAENDIAVSAKSEKVLLIADLFRDLGHALYETHLHSQNADVPEHMLN